MAAETVLPAVLDHAACQRMPTLLARVAHTNRNCVALRLAVHMDTSADVSNQVCLALVLGLAHRDLAPQKPAVVTGCIMAALLAGSIPAQRVAAGGHSCRGFGACASSLPSTRQAEAVQPTDHANLCVHAWGTVPNCMCMHLFAAVPDKWADVPRVVRTPP